MGLGSIFGGGGGSSASTTAADTKEGRELYREQAGLAREQASLIRDARPLVDEQTGLLREQAETARSMRTMAREQWDLYKSEGLGALRELGAKIRDWASPGRIAQQEGMAAADVSASYGRARKGLINQLSRYGIRPGSGKFASSFRALALGEASDTASAKTRTRTGILERDLANSFGLAAAWQGRDSSAMAGLGAAAQNLGAAGRGLGTGYFQAAGALGQAGAGLGSAGRGISGIGLGLEQSSSTRQAGLWSGLGALGGSLGAAWIMSSDRRVKCGIIEIDELPSGIKVYEFNYVDDLDTRYTGVMADEVLEAKPWLVYEDLESGILMVDYTELLAEEVEDYSDFGSQNDYREAA